MNILRPYILIVVVALIVGAIYFISSKSIKRDQISEPVLVIPRSSSESSATTTTIATITPSETSPRYELAKEITTPDGFINTGGSPITISELVGKKVILVDFWTYSCINCQRTTPYLNAWYEKYKDKGFIIIGVHTPEFEFEKDYNNVKAAVEKFGIKFPVVLDNDYSTWSAYKNRYWPRKYLIDINGYIVYDHIGEGAYEETEKKIQELLEVSKEISRPEGIVSVDFSMPRSPEIYFGAARNISPSQTLSDPVDIKTNALYLVGDWDIQNEFAENKNSQAKIIFRYQGKNVYFVAGSENNAKIKIFKDGIFVNEQIVSEHKLYNIIQDLTYGEHMLEIIIENPGLRAFTFTFG